MWESLVCSNNKAEFGKAEGRRMKTCVERKSMEGRLEEWSEMILRASHAELYGFFFSSCRSITCFKVVVDTQ